MALVIHVIVICEHVYIEFSCCSCAIPALFVSVVSYHVVVKELIEGNRIRQERLSLVDYLLKKSSMYVHSCRCTSHPYICLQQILIVWSKSIEIGKRHLIDYFRLLTNYWRFTFVGNKLLLRASWFWSRKDRYQCNYWYVMLSSEQFWVLYYFIRCPRRRPVHVENSF